MAFEAELLRRDQAPSPDPLSASGLALFQQAEALERDILANRFEPTYINDSVPNPVPHDRR